MDFQAALGRLTHRVLAFTRRWVAQAPNPEPSKDLAVTRRMLGLALQGQGQLDLAFEQFKRVPLGEVILHDLFGLALAFERKQQFTQAKSVFQHMVGYPCDDPEIASRLRQYTNPTEPVPDDAGRLLGGRYRLGDVLGKGAMGVVYRGKNTTNGRVVAIKTMVLGQEFEGRDLEDARERFFREAATVGRLQHPNIVTIHDTGEDHDLAFIVMEFLNGKDLTNFSCPGQLLPVSTLLSIAAQVAQALSYAHRQKVVHRDIKPANIMYVVESDTVKVTDFGIARLTDSSKTRTGLVLGTPSFMSPEQLAGKKIDGRSDLYSLGIMLFQLLTGVLPFRAESMAALMNKIASQEAPDLCRLHPELPQSLARLVARLLCKRPQDRYQDGDQLARDLRAVLLDCNAIDLEI